ncbi:2OG-Fe dioxygenase family protein [Streptomyces huiliensis]|uniref:2OG-Fe dioxygenase family protein n=1 Tax=Streptomyces huiliensis TaxID=2876027 RepID=UPI001CC0B994|nr:2OG-Fe dioxygenase family protein [Streptomyces huiliensis]MBZ4323782.1 2OG-Fe dioxygenase family protein [Streptomyces huiliensis]
MDHATDETARPGGPAPAHDPVATARQALAAEGVHLLTAPDVRAHVDGGRWPAFASHWDRLAADPYAAARGTRRLRRYGRFAVTPATGAVRPLDHTAFAQPDRSNPLYVDVDRHFEPLTPDFAADPVLHGLLRLLGRLATALDPTPEWTANVHPFRVLATADGDGQPTPEGRHRDGVTLVSSLAVARHNATGGESTVYTPDGDPLLAVTLTQPGTLLVGDDRATLHEVSPVRPLDPGRPAVRDVLVTTLVPA